MYNYLALKIKLPKLTEPPRQCTGLIMFLFYCSYSCVCRQAHRPQHTLGSSEDNLQKSWSFPSTLWVPGIKLGSSGLVTMPLICRAVLLAPVLHEEPPMNEGQRTRQVRSQLASGT